MSLAESAQEMNRLMDAQMTDAEFDAEVARSRFLHECKTKGFKRLEGLSSLGGGITHGIGFGEVIKDVREQVGPKFNDDNRKEVAQRVADRVKAGEPIGAVCKDIGVDQMSARKWAEKFAIDIPRLKSKPLRISEYKRRQMIKMVNEDGYRLSDVAKKFGMTLNQMSHRIRAWGYKYDQQKIKLTKSA